MPWGEPRLSDETSGKGAIMIPLCFAEPNEEVVVRKVGGSPEVKQHLEDLGFHVGGVVTVVISLNGNLIVKVKESRVAINDEMARRIMV